MFLFPGASLELYKNNITNFLVLEAKDYIGGRVKTEEFEGINLSMGAAWLHNVEENHEIVRLARKHGLMHADDNYDIEKSVIRSDHFVK